MTELYLRVGINAYLPPSRRHWSHVLGRPILSPHTLTADGYDDLGAVYIDEVLGKNCLVTYETYKGTCENIHVGCIPGITRDQVWRARLLDYTNGDEPFMKRWQTIYHNQWPFTNIGVHPALEEPYKRWTEFQEQWVQHCWESEARAISGADMLAG
jgi:hypothetical protein